jgi:glycosyltransferase involved in cell wall biosynthesis
VATYVGTFKSRPVIRRPKRIGMVTYSHYAGDTRVMRYAEALAARGDHVDVISNRARAHEPREEMIRGVNVIKIQDRFDKKEKSSLSLALPLITFTVKAWWRITSQHFRRPYDLLHVHNIPDFLVYCAIVPKLQGAKVILDIHDIVPEFFASKFKTGADGLAIRMLKLMERASAIPVDHVIISNDLWRETYARRTHTLDRCTVYINNVDTLTFSAGLRRRSDDKLVVLFPGGLHWHQGLDIAIQAFVTVRRQLPSAEFHIYGEGSEKGNLVALVESLQLVSCVKFFPAVPAQDITRIMADADLGVVPKRADSFGNEAYSTKIMEFMAVGVPVVISSTKIDRFYFDDSVVRFFDSGNVEALAREMLALLQNPTLRREQAGRASAYARQHSWESRRGHYLALVDSLAR